MDIIHQLNQSQRTATRTKQNKISWNSFHTQSSN